MELAIDLNSIPDGISFEDKDESINPLIKTIVVASFDISNLESGIYFIILKDTNNFYSAKFIKQ